MASERTSLGLVCALCAFAVSFAALPARAAEPAEVSAAAPQLQSEMLALRRLVVDHHTLITHRRLSPGVARKLAAEVRALADRLAATPVAASHAKVAAMAVDIRAAAALMDQGPASPDMLQGLMRLVAVLDSYPKAFAHPEWKALQDLR